MYMNYSRVTELGMSIAECIISLFLSVLFIIVGTHYEGAVLAGFILLTIGFVLLAGSSIVAIIKCILFGSKNALKSNPPENVKDKKNFALLTNLIAIFTLLSFVCLVVALIILLK